MKDRIKIRFDLQTLAKTAGLLSNSVTLATNAYLLGTGLKRNLDRKKAERISEHLHLAAEISSALAGLTQVIVNTLETTYAQRKIL